MIASNNDIVRFKTYVKNHVHIVNILSQHVFNIKYPDHDKDKLLASGKTLNAYALRNAQFNSANLQIPKSDQLTICRVLMKHVKQNSHHPEFWDPDISEDTSTPSNQLTVKAYNMSDSAIKEMCCDWAAVALAKNVSLSDWYNQTVDTRFLFTTSQKAHIQEYLKLLEDYIISTDLKFPGHSTFSADVAKFKEEYKMSNSIKNKIAAITFGRMNPMTIGHMLVCKQLHELEADAKYIYLSHTQSSYNSSDPLKNTNPLPYDLKVLYVEAFLRESPFSDVTVHKSAAKTILDAAEELYSEGFTELKVVVGSDRVADFTRLLNKYNNTLTSEGVLLYNFNNIDVISAGNRDADSANNVVAMSASKMRKFAVAGDIDSFIRGTPTTDKHLARELFKDTRKYMLGPNLYFENIR